MINKLGKKKEKGSPPATPASKVKSRNETTGELSSPEERPQGRHPSKGAGSSQSKCKGKSFLDNLLDSALACDFSQAEKDVVETCSAITPANATGLTLRKRFNQAKKRSASKKQQEKDSKKHGKKFSKTQKKGNQGVEAANNTKKKANQKKEDGVETQHAEGQEGAPDGQRSNSKKAKKEVKEEVPTKEDMRSTTKAWSVEELNKLPRQKARHVITSRAYHKALALHRVKKQDAKNMTAEQLEEHTKKARDVAREAGRQAGVDFDKQRPKPVDID